MTRKTSGTARYCPIIMATLSISDWWYQPSWKFSMMPQNVHRHVSAAEMATADQPSTLTR
jgi:hypothetical protein